MFKLNGQQLYTGWIVINLFHINICIHSEPQD